MDVRKKLEDLIYNYFMEEYENHKIAEQKSKSISEEIIYLIASLNNQVQLGEFEKLTKTVHTLKHLLLYADLDNISDMCQELEDTARKGKFDKDLKDKIISEIVK